eukprot:m.27789 g.27789  ORF g.27789 m.27789 type:complete len:80 (+) comp30348_c0_seq1:137-376(+)
MFNSTHHIRFTIFEYRDAFYKQFQELYSHHCLYCFEQMVMNNSDKVTMSVFLLTSPCNWNSLKETTCVSISSTKLFHCP